MKKYIIFALSLILLPSISFAQGRNNATQQVTQQRDIADYNCKNNLPNPRAAIGYCKKRDGLQKKLDNMDRGQNYNNNRYNHNNNRYDRNNHNYRNNRHYNHHNHRHHH